MFCIRLSGDNSVAYMREIGDRIGRRVCAMSVRSGHTEIKSAADDIHG